LIDEQIAESALKYQREIEAKERIIVGLNEFVSPHEEPLPGGIHRYSPDSERAHIENVRRLKRERSSELMKKAMDEIKREAEKGETNNLIPAIMNALNVGALTDEIIGTIRVAFGYSYDPFEMVESPF
jgi:methylmalonyl-CoA mutase N-terminal domain/subunit